jgi:hypothetical protein
MKHLAIAVATLALVTGLVAVGCAKKQVSRVDVGETIDLSGRWNDTDSRMVAETMVSKPSRVRGWTNTSNSTGRSPRSSWAPWINRSHEHISVPTFTKIWSAS